MRILKFKLFSHILLPSHYWTYILKFIWYVCVIRKDIVANMHTDIYNTQNENRNRKINIKKPFNERCRESTRTSLLTRNRQI